MPGQPDPRDDAARQILATLDVVCQMQHPHPTKKQHKAVPCERPAAWIATIHDCTKKRDYPNNGTTVPICQWYLDEYARKVDFPFRCPGCAQDITNLTMLIWDIAKI